MTKPDSAAHRGPGFLTLLGLLFIGLKLAGCIDWAWWVVLAPIWAPLAIAAVLLLIVGVCEYYQETH